MQWDLVLPFVFSLVMQGFKEDVIELLVVLQDKAELLEVAGD